jgi:rod shape-determining protein MreD
LEQLKIAGVLALAIALQTSLRAIWDPVVFIDLPLIVVVYFALQRDVLKALIIGAAAGLATDALSGGGLLGAGGFSKTLTAYVISALSTRVMLDHPLTRIPVLAGAALLDATVFNLLHRMLDQRSLRPFVETVSFKLIGTTIVGTAILYALDNFFGERAHQRRQLAFRRRVARRTPSRRFWRKR